MARIAFLVRYSERHGDAQAFASRWVAFSRASIFPTLAAQLTEVAPADAPSR